VLAILALTALAWSLGQTTIIAGFPQMAHEFGTNASGVAWTFTGYLAASAVSTPLLGQLGDVLGRRRVLVAVMLVVSLGNVVSALGQSMAVVVAGRILQGLGGGIFPLCVALLREQPASMGVARGVGTLSALVAVGLGGSLILGGLLVDHGSFRAVFWTMAALTALCAAGVHLLIEHRPATIRRTIDLKGAVVLAIGLGLPLVAISRASDWGWTSPSTVGLIVAGAVMLAVWLEMQRRSPDRWVIDSLTHPPVLMTNIATFLLGFGIFGAFMLAPQMVQAPERTGYGLGIDATGAGLLLLPGAVLILVVGPLAGALGRRTGHKVPLALGGLVAATGLTGLALRHGSAPAVIVFGGMLSAGLIMCFAAMPNLIVEAVAADRTGEATGFNGLARTVGGSIGGQVTAALLAGSAAATSAFPDEAGYTAAFGVSALAAIGGAVLAACIPRVR
jgi:MFS family permease